MRWFIIACGLLQSGSEAEAAWSWQRQHSQQQQQSQAPQPPQQLRIDEVQILLDRTGFSVGEIDGRPGANTQKAVTAFQQSYGLPITGELDEATVGSLWKASGGRAWTYYTLSDEDTTGPFLTVYPSTMQEKAQLDYLGYTSVYAKLGEKFHIKSALLRDYNPGIPFKPGQRLTVPNVVPMELSRTGKAVSGLVWSEYTIVVSKSNLTLQLFDSQNQMLFHAPITIGGKNDPLRLGNWRVEGVDRNPRYNYNPALFWDASTSDTKCIVPPGPNNPVGVVWINLNVAHVGIHGTPSPGRIGYAVSHGCVRLTNWDVLRLAALVGPGTNVIFKE